MRKVKNFIRSVLGINNLTNHYSQGGEDAIAWNILASFGIEKGTYIDIGAHHPYFHSNTYLFYKAGWRGINIDPIPGMKMLFDKMRKGDINLEIGIGESHSSLDYYILEDNSTMNTFSKDNLVKLNMLDKVKEVKKVEVLPLNEVIERYPQFRKLTYLNIDAEGFELQILSGMKELSPLLISLEQNNVITLSDVLETETYKFLRSKGYIAIAKNVIYRDVATVFYLNEEIIKS